MTIKSRKLAVISLLVTGLWSGGALASAGYFERDVAVDEPIVLDVRTGAGSIEITAGSSDTVRIEGNVRVSKRSFLGLFKRSDERTREMVAHIEANPPIELVGGVLRVGHFEDSEYKRDVSISYTIVVPASTEVISHTGSGSQSIDGVLSWTLPPTPETLVVCRPRVLCPKFVQPVN